ncbi:hypothetical protein DAERI_020228 [Deinococcus aerius]|uniref:Uncharacterized protein n=2 Tax=Deinococcus TaxID=1298 RepID=A0A2I9DIQ3_9DEIO|nr:MULTISPECIES: hypothetical protein [Deinococcus]MBB5293909.1 hypothetical protein [Deinococcus metallilatus]QBY07149.1 hypothetical protein E5F05_03975 [Deinococcus metallilatus]RXJ14621.1 hypothetical protein ERJ73_02705 [Deinococcus metallilatus]TLK30741.1 hypothetical protein FCS05_03020 [Deinococcus metallilatus]GBF04631.1 hypothetical protein DAERI_020228 [Deinococcus aerius]
MTLFLASLLLGSGFAAIHLLSPALRVPDGVPRNRLLSAAGGLAVAFIFLRILPEFGDSQQVFGATPRGTLLGLPGHHVSVIAFVSLVLCSAVGRLVQTLRAQQRAAIGHGAPGERVFWMHLPTDALDNFVIASLLAHRADTRGWLSLGRLGGSLSHSPSRLWQTTTACTLYTRPTLTGADAGSSRWPHSPAGTCGSSPTSPNSPPRPWRRFRLARPC